MKRIFLLATTMLLLSACASSGTREGMVYRNGSWYAPADEGHGDYYTSTPRTYPYYAGAYDYPFDFGIGLLPYGGYCSVQYRWCSSFWPYYDPYWYQPWVSYQSAPRHPRHRGASLAESDPQDASLPLPRSSEARERARPDTWEERPVHAPRSGSGGDGRRRRGGGNLGGTGFGDGG